MKHRWLHLGTIEQSEMIAIKGKILTRLWQMGYSFQPQSCLVRVRLFEINPLFENFE